MVRRRFPVATSWRTLLVAPIGLTAFLSWSPPARADASTTISPANSRCHSAPFFRNLRAYCRVASELARVADGDATPKLAAQELLTFCAGKGLPSVASLGQRERMALLVELNSMAAQLGLHVTLERAEPAARFESLVPPPRVLTEIQAPLAAEASRAILTLAAGQQAVERWLPRIGALARDRSGASERPLVVVYRALIADLLSLPSQLPMNSQAAGVEQEANPLLIEVLALLGSLTTPETMASALVDGSELVAQEIDSAIDSNCLLGLPPGVPRTLTWREALGIVLRRWIDDSSTGLSSAEDLGRSLRMIEADIAEAGWHWPGTARNIAAPDPAALARLAAHLAQWDALGKRLTPQDSVDVNELQQLLAIGLLTIVETSRLAFPGWSLELPSRWNVAALGDGTGADRAVSASWPRDDPALLAARRLLGWVDAVMDPQTIGWSTLVQLLPNAGELRQLGGLLDLARDITAARSGDEVRAILARLLEQAILGPWSKPWLFDLNLSVPSLANNDFAINGDTLVGYNAMDWGVTGNAGLQHVDVWGSDGRRYVDFKRGAVEGWWCLPGRSMRVEVRAALTLGESLFVQTRTTGSTLYVWEDVAYGTGTLLAAMLYRGDPSIAGGVWLGAGYQTDQLQRRAIPNTSQSLWIEDSRANSYLALEARLRGEWRFAPGWLALRFRADARRYDVTRDAFTEVDGQGFAVAGTRRRSYSQTQLSSRLFLDATVAEFVGFAPSIHVGLDAWMFAGNTDLNDLLIPVFGAGIKRDAW